MEYIEGMDLKYWSKLNKIVKSQDMINIIKSVIQGLEFLHRNGISHRDIKPSNIIISNTGIVKIADFGLNCFKSLNDCGTLAGTPNYVAPEIWQGNHNYVNYITADIWSAGMTFYVVSNIKLPFNVSDMKEIRGKVIGSNFKSNAKFLPMNGYEAKWINSIINIMLVSNNQYRPNIKELLYLSDNEEFILYNNNIYIKYMFVHYRRQKGINVSIDISSKELKTLFLNTKNLDL